MAIFLSSMLQKGGRLDRQILEDVWTAPLGTCRIPMRTRVRGLNLWFRWSAGQGSSQFWLFRHPLRRQRQVQSCNSVWLVRDRS